MAQEPKLADRDALLVLATHPTVRVATIGRTLQEAFAGAYRYLLAAAADPLGPPFVVYAEPVTFDGSFEIDICVPVARPVEPPAGWTMERLPAGRFASLVHVGPYDTLGAAYDQLRSWIEREGLTVTGAPREVYLSEPATPASQVRTVVEFPVEAIASEAGSS